MIDRNTLERAAATALRKRAFANRGALPPAQLARLGHDIVGLLLDPPADLRQPVAQLVSRGLAFISASDAGRAVQQAALSAGDADLAAAVASRYSDLLTLWHEAELAELLREQEDLRDAVTRALSDQREESDRQRAAIERGQQEQERLAALVTELSAPVIPLYDGVLALPLIGSIDSRRAQDVMEHVLERIAATRAESLIIDITGVAVVDTGVIQHLLQTARAVSLLGATVILVGINPEIAQTITQLGIEITEIATLSTLQDGVAHALRQRGLAVRPITASPAAGARPGTARSSPWQ